MRKFVASGVMRADADVVAVLTGNLLKDPDYVYHYHTGQLKGPHGQSIRSSFGNQPIRVPNDAGQIERVIANTR